MRSFSYPLATACLLLSLTAPALADSGSDLMEELTWPEIAERITTGTDTVIIPTGGTEQNGPHLATGKHNWIVEKNAIDIAQSLGNALVAPVLAYVPEGTIHPPQGHMHFPGTISLTEKTYSAVLEDTARSFKQHGFKLICFLGDSGGNQPAQAELATALNKQWDKDGVIVLNVSDYYEAKEAIAWATRQKLGGIEPSAHAGFMDTSELLSIRPHAVRTAAITHYQASDQSTTGVAGDPSDASPTYGEKLLALRVAAAVKQIKEAQSRLKR